MHDDAVLAAVVCDDFRAGRCRGDLHRHRESFHLPDVGVSVRVLQRLDERR